MTKRTLHVTADASAVEKLEAAMFEAVQQIATGVAIALSRTKAKKLLTPADLTAISNATCDASEAALSSYANAMLTFIDPLKDQLLQTANAALAEENEKLRSLCAEAAALYAQGGTFPINGEMSERLRLVGRAQ